MKSAQLSVVKLVYLMKKLEMDGIWPGSVHAFTNKHFLLRADLRDDGE